MPWLFTESRLLSNDSAINRPVTCQPQGSCLCTRASVTKQEVVMHCGWEGNRRCGISIAMHHRLSVSPPMGSRPKEGRQAPRPNFC